MATGHVDETETAGETVTVEVDANMLVQVAIIVAEMQQTVARIDNTVQALAERMLGERKVPECPQCGLETVVVNTFAGRTHLCPDHGEVEVGPADGE